MTTGSVSGVVSDQSGAPVPGATVTALHTPTGTTYGVSAFQINFGSRVIKTAGDQPDVLVAFNPAALKVNHKQVRRGGIVI